MLVVTAFQIASGSADAVSVRFVLPELALLLILAARGAGPLMLGAALAVNVAYTALYDANFTAESSGRSNAFAAARWIEANLPEGSKLGLDVPAPMLDRFPPIAFSRYDLVYFHGPVPPKKEKQLPEWFLANGLGLDSLSPDVRRLYVEERSWDAFHARGRGFRNLFTLANFPVVLLRKRA
jgi:hypothetical protein